MKDITGEKLQWIRNRLKRKYKIKTGDTQKVLDAISDLTWDWRGSKYDLYGLELMDVLEDLGNARTPKQDEGK